MTSRAAGRPKHPRKDLEEICQLVEAKGWRITRRKGYFKAWCPCGLHKRTIHLSPSTMQYSRNLRQWFKRQPCWVEEPS